MEVSSSSQWVNPAETEDTRITCFLMNRIRMLAAENTELKNQILFERRQGEKHKVSLRAVREEKEKLRKERNLQAEQIKELQAENFAATQLIEKLKAMKDDKTQQPAARPATETTNTMSTRPVIEIKLNEVKLARCENAWRPGRRKPATNEQAAQTQELLKKARSLLNKLTPDKFDRLVSQVQDLPIDSSDRLKGVIDLIFEKAVDEPKFTEIYARMCKVLSSMKVPAERGNNGEPEVTFRKLLLGRCRAEFEKNPEAEINLEATQKEIEETADPAKKTELQQELRRIRMKSIGNIRFIGELHKADMLATSTMQHCIKRLLTKEDEHSLECLCTLLMTVGKDLESKSQDLSEFLHTMKELTNKKAVLSSRIKFKIDYVIDLKQSNWAPRNGR